MRTNTGVRMVVAGLLEAFARQLVDSTLWRMVIGYSLLVFWLLYFFAWRHVPLASEAA